MEQLQSHIWLTASSYMVKCLCIYSYIRMPFLKYGFATAPFWIFSYIWGKFYFIFFNVVSKGAAPWLCVVNSSSPVSPSSSSIAEFWSLTNSLLAASAASHEDSIMRHPWVNPSNGRPSSCEGLFLLRLSLVQNRFEGRTEVRFVCDYQLQFRESHKRNSSLSTWPLIYAYRSADPLLSWSARWRGSADLYS